VQEALGHASLNTSRIYTHFDSDKLKLAAKVAEDLANEGAQNRSKLAILNLTYANLKHQI
jgi:site-specific recombinase, phage integrase family